MKYLFSAIACLLLTSALSGQSTTSWEKRYFVDKYNDPTGESYETIKVLGSMRNSVVGVSSCTFVFVIDSNPKHSYINVLDYGKFPTDFYGAPGDRRMVSIKTPSGKDIKMFCSTSSSRISLKRVLKSVDFKEKGVYKIHVRKNIGAVYSSSYNLTFKI